MKPGDKVTAPYGFETVRARVVQVYGPPESRHVLLELDGNKTYALPVDAVTPRRAAALEGRDG